jgi:hypothetical protein
MQYLFIYNDGTEKEFPSEAACLASIENATGLDSIVARICLNDEGVSHPSGKWVRRKS